MNMIIMNANEKIEYVLGQIRETARIKPAGPFYFGCAALIDIEANNSIPDEAPIIISSTDKANILRKFDEDGLIYILDWDKNHQGAWIALINLDKNANDNPYKPVDRPIQIIDFPQDLKWEEISIRFINSQDVIVRYRRQTFQTNYEAMGFANMKNKKPTEPWNLLVDLAGSGGEFNWQNNHRLDYKGSYNLKKRKQLLADGLKKYFHNNEDPFNVYKKEKSYKLKIRLVPEDTSPLEKDDDIDSFHKEQTYSVYE